MKILGGRVMASLDERTQKEYGIPAALLMENAGRSAAEYLLGMKGPGNAAEGPIVVVAGKGNNGGDALVAARHLYIAGRKDLRVLLASKDLGELAALHAGILTKLGVPLEVFSPGNRNVRRLLTGAGLIVDGLFGIGVSGRLRAPGDEIVNLVSSSKAKIVSLDVPSGLFDGYRPEFPAVKADVTLTFELPKLCLYLPAGRKLSGKIEVLPVGFPPALTAEMPGRLELLGDDFLRSAIPPLPPDAYKNSRGHLAVLAGNRGTTGAAALCSEAALRSGAGLVSLFADEAVYPILASAMKSVMVKPLQAAPSDWKPSGFSAFLAGPGWGRGRAPWLRTLLGTGIPGVLDADGIHVLKEVLEGPNRPKRLEGWVLTPHVGEFAAFTGRQKEEILVDPLPFLEETAGKLGCVVVLKGHVTYIAAPSGKIFVHDGMNPALGTAGSGDVLAGIIAGLLAMGVAPVTAAAAGVDLHGRAGKLAAEKTGMFTAEDLLPYLSFIAGLHELQ